MFPNDGTWSTFSAPDLNGPIDELQSFCFEFGISCSEAAICLKTVSCNRVKWQFFQSPSHIDQEKTKSTQMFIQRT